MPTAFTTANACVLAAALLPIVCSAAAKAGRRDFDNHHPRAWGATLTGWRARALAAQANGFEGLPFFIGAVVIAQQMQAPQGRVDTLALGWIALRIAYCALYMADRSTLRSLVYAAALLVNVALLFAGSW